MQFTGLVMAFKHFLSLPAFDNLSDVSDFFLLSAEAALAALGNDRELPS